MKGFISILRFWLIIGLGFLAMNGGAKFLIKQRQYTNEALIKIDQFKIYQEANFIVLGNSRPACAVIPSVLEKEFAKEGLVYRVYNLAIPGATSSDVSLLYKDFVQLRKPEILLIQAEPDWFQPNYEKEAEQRVYRLFLQPHEIPWMFRNATVTWEQGLEYAVGSLLPIVRYRSEVREWLNNFDVSLDQSAYQDELSKISDAGYRKLDGSPKEIDDPKNIARFHLTDSAQVILKTVELALSQGTKVFVIDYPNYDYVLSPKYQQRVQGFFAKRGCSYLNYLADSRFRNKALFFDEGHLNRKGAKLFTQQLAKDLSEIVLHQNSIHSP